MTKNTKKKTIFTIGHSNRTRKELIEMLQAFDIEILVDIRHYPASWHNPQFNKDTFARSLRQKGIDYIHLLDLGGRRPHVKGLEINAGWRSNQFRGYADYMQTDEFYMGMAKLIFLARGATVAIMCSEAVPWRCHRSMVSDALIVEGFEVLDIFNKKDARTHKLTSFINVKGHKITYPATQI